MNDLTVKEIARDARHNLATLVAGWSGPVDSTADKIIQEAIKKAMQAAYEDAAKIADEVAQRSAGLVDDTTTSAARLTLLSNAKVSQNLAAAIRQRAKEVTQ